MIKQVLVLASACSFGVMGQTRADLERMMKELSNWGRWGAEDQRGALNLITSEKSKRAVALVREGVTVSLAHDVEKMQAVDNPSVFEHKMLASGVNPSPTGSARDQYSVAYHGYAHTHLDALCHMFFGGKIYNGVAQSEVTDAGCGKNSIYGAKTGIVSRGVLLDIPKLKGVPYLEPQIAVTPEDLDAWIKKAGIKMEPGDVVFLRTGRWARRKAVGPWNVSQASAGFNMAAARWLKRNDVAIVGSDAASDLLPSGVEGEPLPVHKLLLVAMGVHIFDNADLEVLSEVCAKRNRWTFLVVAAPLPVSGGTGSPLNPIAVF
jgi:kynurenine formamidase